MPTSFMPKHRRLILAAASGLTIVASFIFVLALWPSDEPGYKGQPLSYWISLYLSPNFPNETFVEPAAAPAEEAIHHIGTNAIPFLLRWASYDSLRGQERFFRLPGFLYRVPHLDKLFYSEQRDRLSLAAGRALIALGPDASPALPALRTMLDLTNTVGTPTRALWILQHIGPPAIPVLMEAASDQNNNMRLVIIGNLAAMGRDGTAAVPALTLLLQDTNPFVRHNSAHALAAITGQSITNFRPDLHSTPPLSSKSSASVANEAGNPKQGRRPN
jgi:hypothetical protein